MSSPHPKIIQFIFSVIYDCFFILFISIFWEFKAIKYFIQLIKDFVSSDFIFSVWTLLVLTMIIDKFVLHILLTPPTETFITRSQSAQWMKPLNGKNLSFARLFLPLPPLWDSIINWTLSNSSLLTIGTNLSLFYPLNQFLYYSTLVSRSK